MSVAPRATGKLTVTVHEGKDLTNKDVGKQDPFVKLKLGEESFKTKTHKKGGKEPKFKESFLFNVKDYDLKEKLHLEAWDEDALSNDKIGLVSIPLDTLIQEAHKDDGYWFQIHAFDDQREIAGYIRISVVAEGTGFPGSHPVATAALHKLEEKVEGIKHKVEEIKHKEEEASKKKTEELPPIKTEEKHVEPVKPVHGHETRVRSKQSGLFLGIKNAVHKEGGEARFWKKKTKDADNQILIFVERKDGTYEIAAKHSSKYLVPDKPDAEDSKIEQQTLQDNASFRWILHPHGDGTFRIVNAHSGKSLDFKEGADKGILAIQHKAEGDASQKFTIDPPLPTFWCAPRDGLETRIQSKHSELFLDVHGASKDDGAELIQWNENHGANQVFVFHEHHDGSCEIVSKNSGKYLTVDDKQGSKVTQHTKTGSPHQRFLLKHIDAKTFHIISLASGLALDVHRNSKDKGTDIIQWKLKEGTAAANQTWIVENWGH